MESLMRNAIFAGAVGASLLIGIRLKAQANSGSMPNLSSAPNGTPRQADDFARDTQAEAELQKGTGLTRSGKFAEAIPHLVASRGKVMNNYAADFNLALCYIATAQPKLAIPILTDLRASGHDSADVNNLLAQAYVGESENEKALDALRRAAAFNPENEKLYMFVADTCTTNAN